MGSEVRRSYRSRRKRCEGIIARAIAASAGAWSASRKRWSRGEGRLEGRRRVGCWWWSRRKRGMSLRCCGRSRRLQAFQTWWRRVCHDELLRPARIYEVGTHLVLGLTKVRVFTIARWGSFGSIGSVLLVSRFEVEWSCGRPRYRSRFV